MAGYQTTIGDRSELFAAIALEWEHACALYPGSYVDSSVSTAIPSVTYVDTDKRAARYFANEELVRSELRGVTRPGAGVEVAFLHADYTTPLALPRDSFDLLISLYAGPVFEHCRAFLRPGGLLLANTSHGDASLAALDPDVELLAAVLHREGHYHLDRYSIHEYLVPKKASAADAEAIRSSGRGIPYTKAAFAYLFRVHKTPAL